MQEAFSMLENLSFLISIKSNQVSTGIDYLRSIYPKDNKHADFWKYLESTWLKKFDLELWTFNEEKEQLI